jgi:hypothetical protein
MIKINDTLISSDIVEVKFACNLKHCFGECCVSGDAGAPLEEEEISIIEDYIDKIKPYLTEKGKQIIENCGIFDYDADGEFVTPLIDNQECAFTYFENNIAFCAIEKAFIDRKIDFLKPVSCHLYPIRITKHKTCTAVNFHDWDICKSALKNGENKGIPLYQFLKEPLIRKFGKDWYDRLLDLINLRKATK